MLKRCVILFVSVLVVRGVARAAEFKAATYGPGSLTFSDGIPVIHLRGTPEQMGEQCGKLLGPQVQTLIREYLHRLVSPRQGDTGAWASVLRLSREMEKSIPQDAVREMKALAAAAEVNYDDILIANTIFDLKRSLHCSTVVAVGQRSADGRPIFARNMDFHTLGVAHKFSCIIVYHPDKGRAVASVTFPGLVGVITGMNDAGVSIGTMEVHVRGANTAASPYAMVFRAALTDAATTEDVLKTIRTRARSSTNNLMICDAEGNAACAELSGKTVVTRRPENGVIYSTNHFQSKELGGPWFCWRLPRIRKALEDGAKVDAARLKKILLDVAQEGLTMHSVIFRPAAQEFELAVGAPPSAARSYVLIRKSTLFPEPAGR